MALDPRLNAYRPDLAAAHLKGRVEARTFVEGTRKQVRCGTAALKSEPADDAALATQVLFGEVFTVFEDKVGWSWGQAGSDSYVGYVRSDSLSGDVIAPTHRVTALASHIYPAPDIKHPPLDLLPMAAEVAIKAAAGDDRFVALATGGWMIRKHLAGLGESAPDYVATAERLMGFPYLWGGKSTVAGIDCSGLVQISLALAGQRVLRDSDMQAETIGEALPEGVDVKRGDIVCFPGHIGFLADSTMLLHANAYAMCVSNDPLEEVIERVRAEQAQRSEPKPPVTCIRRLSR